MNIITNHTARAINFIVPYLREFYGIKELAQVNGDRWQEIENAIWYILMNLNVDIAEGNWLDLLGEKAGKSREIYIPDSTLFLFDSASQGLDLGLLAEKSTTGGGSYSNLDDEVYRLFIKFAFVSNNFDGTRASLIAAIKILTGATKVIIEETGSLKMDLTLYVTPPTDFINTYEDLIKQLVPQCVEVGTITYVSP